MNFLGLIRDLHQLRTSFNKVLKPYLHIQISEHCDVTEVLKNVDSTMALTMVNECIHTLRSLGYSKRFHQRKEGENTLLLFLENHHDKIHGSLFILKSEYAKYLYDYLAAYQIVSAVPRVEGGLIDLNRYSKRSPYLIKRFFKQSHSIFDLFDGTIREVLEHPHAVELDYVTNPLSLNKLWCGVSRTHDVDGNEMIQHTKLGCEDGVYYYITHYMDADQYEFVLDELVRVPRTKL